MIQVDLRNDEIEAIVAALNAYEHLLRGRKTFLEISEVHHRISLHQRLIRKLEKADCSGDISCHPNPNNVAGDQEN